MNFRKIALITATAVILTAFTGCGSKNGGSSASSEKLDGKFASKDKIELKVHLITKETGVFKDEWPIFKKAGELTNVSLKGTLPKTTTDEVQAFNLMIASGDIPDIVQTNNVNFFKYGSEGAFEPLDELINKNAPNLKKFFEENPDVKKVAAGPDGKIWFIPFILDGDAQSGWFIREDWLNKLGLKQPKTVDEYYEVLKAFRDKDPNGNGKKDEIPYFHRSPELGISDLFVFWKAEKAFFEKDGKVKFGPYEEEYKTALENISKWYAEGLIDKEIFTRGGKARDILLSANTGGSTHDWFASTANYNDMLKSKINGFSFEPITPPAGVDGIVREATKRVRAKNFGWGISSKNKHKVETIKYFDFWFSVEGRRMANFGIEGDTYTMKDGKPIFTDKVLKGQKPAVDVIRETGAQAGFGFQQDFFYEEQWTNPIALKGIKEYVDKKYIQKQYPTLVFTNEEQKELDKIMIPINTFIQESTQQWVLGAKPMDYAKFKEQLKKMNIERAIEINQKALERYNKK